ncbi:hypothetical protein [Anabaena sp. PCC 7108]|uniref:hypothetical protein n=1 Tax=Anabaena sp. PCC 7108 TaxID=163908 RepID=UPI00034CC665|nr:hypothetical protein [Anabaena sp. PCC 7108]
MAIELLGLLMGMIGTLLAIGSSIFWWNEQDKKNEVKKYAAEREFGHIKNALIQQSSSLANEFQDIDRKLDAIKDDVQEIKFKLNVEEK